MNNPRSVHVTVCVNKTNKFWPVLNIVHYRLQQRRCNYVSERKAARAISKGRTSLRFHNRLIFPRDPKETRAMDFLRPGSTFGFIHPSAFLILILNCCMHLSIKFLGKWTRVKTGCKSTSSPLSYTTWSMHWKRKSQHLEQPALEIYHTHFLWIIDK